VEEKGRKLLFAKKKKKIYICHGHGEKKGRRKRSLVYKGGGEGGKEAGGPV